MKQIQSCFEGHMAQLLWPADGRTEGIFRLRVREAGSEAWVSDSRGIPHPNADAHLGCNFVRKLKNLSNGTWNVRADQHKIVNYEHGSNINIESISLVQGMCCLVNFLFYVEVLPLTFCRLTAQSRTLPHHSPAHTTESPRVASKYQYEDGVGAGGAGDGEEPPQLSPPS